MIFYYVLLYDIPKSGCFLYQLNILEEDFYSKRNILFITQLENYKSCDLFVNKINIEIFFLSFQIFLTR